MDGCVGLVWAGGEKMNDCRFIGVFSLGVLRGNVVGVEMCVYVYVCMCVYMYYVYVYVCENVDVFVCVCVYVYICVFVCLCVCVCIRCLWGW